MTVELDGRTVRAVATNGDTLTVSYPSRREAAAVAARIADELGVVVTHEGAEER